MRSIRGGEIALIPQEPMASFSPVHTVGSQIVEAVRLHMNVNKREAQRIAIERLHEVGMPSPEQRMDAYSWELSGGLRQRAMIAMALSCNPRLLIADEPTTAIDVTTQAQVLNLLRRLQQELNMSIIFITHDLGVIAQIADYVVVMYSAVSWRRDRWMISFTIRSILTRSLYWNPSPRFTRHRRSFCQLSKVLSRIPSTVRPAARFIPVVQPSCLAPVTGERRASYLLTNCNPSAAFCIMTLQKKMAKCKFEHQKRVIVSMFHRYLIHNRQFL